MVMLTRTRGAFQRFTIGLLIVAAICLAGGLMVVMPAQAGSASLASVAPLNPVFLESVGSPNQSSTADGRVLGGGLTLQDFSYAAGMQVPSTGGAPPATYDLRTLGRVTSVKNQNPYGTCWAFASFGSLESCLLPGETQDFSEDNMALTSGFNLPGGLYNGGGHHVMSTAYLVRWGGPVNESDDAYGDSYTPPGLTPRKHVQEVNWVPARDSALDNDNLKNAVMQYGGAMVWMSWPGSTAGDSYYKASTASYYYNGSEYAGHLVLVVGWDDNYAAANFATTPPGNGAFIVKNSWGTGWGNSGYFYVSYYDSLFGRENPAAVFSNAESAGNYTGIYQYDPLGAVNAYGFGSSIGWFANVFTAQATASLSAVGFYTEVPGATYEIYTGSSLATKTLRSSGTLAYMGYHTVALPSAVGITSGQQFVVAVKMTSPGYNYPIAYEYPKASYSSAATAAAGQSYVSSNGSSWTDLTTSISNANVCLKAYVTTAVAAPTLTITSPTGPGTYTSGSTMTVNWTSDQSLSGGEFGVWVRSATEDWYIGQLVPATGDFTKTITLGLPAGSGYQVILAYRPTAGSGSWGSWTTSWWSFTVTSGLPYLTITSPTGPGTYTSGSTMTVNWTSDQSLSGGEFGVWVRSATEDWYIGQLVPATGDFTKTITLGLPAGSGYQVILAYRPTAGSGSWGSWTTSWWSFTVTSGLPYLTITSPTGPGTYTSGSTMTVNWTSDQSLSGGEFGVWVRSATEDWYIGQLVPATGDFTKTITLGLPAGSGYQVILAYRPTAGSGSWGSWTTSWWSFTVTAGLPYLTITSPTGPGTYTSGSTMTVNWTSDQSLSGGQFCAWVRSGSGTWYIGQLVPASEGTDFTTDLVLNVPTGTGYQVIVAYRPTVGSGSWGSFVTSWWSFAVTAATTPFSDGFEAGLGQWTLIGSPTWGTTTYRAGAGSWSAYCAGSSVAPPGPYLNNMANWMVAGPFDLSAVTTATLEYDQYLSTELSYDYCYAMVSTDGSTFNGSGWSGSSGGSWTHRTLDLSSVAGGPYIGDASVWVAFRFESDSINTGEGAYIDNVELVTGTGSSLGNPPTTGINPPSSPVVTRTIPVT